MSTHERAIAGEGDTWCRSKRNERMVVGEQFHGPIFISGASRSGTAMLRSSLNLHPDILIGPETHYFDDLRPRLDTQATQPLQDESQRKMVEDYFLAIAHRPYGHGGTAEQSRIPRAELRELTATIGQSGDAYFEAFCKLFGKLEEGGSQFWKFENGGGVWGEKTPRHVFRLPEMLECYPEGKAIVMVRDPRAVVASYRDWKNQGGFDLEKDPGHAKTLEAEQKRTRASYDPALATLLWRGTVGAAVKAEDEFGKDRVRIQRYEDLVTDLVPTLKDIASWLNIAYDPVMENVPILNSSFSSFDKKGGANTEAIRRWEKKLSSKEVRTVEFFAGKNLDRMGYDRVEKKTGPIRATGALIRVPLVGTRAALANRDRIDNLPKYIWRRATSIFRGK